MRPVAPRQADRHIPLPGFYVRGQGFTRRAGQIFVYPEVSADIVALRLAEGLALRPSLYLEARD